MNVFLNEVIVPLDGRAEQEVNMSKVRRRGFVSYKLYTVTPRNHAALYTYYEKPLCAG